MNENIKVKEFVELLEQDLKSMEGKNVKDIGIKNLMKEALSDTTLDYLKLCNLEYDTCEIKTIYKELVVFSTKAHYKSDKRKWNGISDKIDHIEVIVNSDISMDEELAHVEQIIEYYYYKRNYLRLEQEYREKMKEVAHLREYMRDNLYQMSVVYFDDETRREIMMMQDVFNYLVRNYKAKVVTERAKLSKVKDWVKKWKYDIGEEKAETDDKVVVYRVKNQRDPLYEGHILDIPEELYDCYISDYLIDEIGDKGKYILNVYSL